MGAFDFVVSLTSFAREIIEAAKTGPEQFEVKMLKLQDQFSFQVMRCVCGGGGGGGGNETCGTGSSCGFLFWKDAAERIAKLSFQCRSRLARCEQLTAHGIE